MLILPDYGTELSLSTFWGYKSEKSVNGAIGWMGRGLGALWIACGYSFYVANQPTATKLSEFDVLFTLECIGFKSFVCAVRFFALLTPKIACS